MSNSIPVTQVELANKDISLERDGFCRSIIRELSGLLEEMVGLEEAAGFISVVGQNIGHSINDEYKKAFQVSLLSREQCALVMTDLKHRIKGGFSIVEQNDTKVVFENSTCPFAEKVIGRSSLCMMTSNVFGTVAAENNDYAKVVLEKTIARGDSGCRVAVYFDETSESEANEGREYYSAK